MTQTRRPFLLFAMLLAIGLRTVFGAPFCMPPAHAAEVVSPDGQAAVHAHHAHEFDVVDNVKDGHSDHEDDPTAMPCCSGCGPALSSKPATFTATKVASEVRLPSAIRELEMRAPFPAYDATGPPLLI